MTNASKMKKELAKIRKQATMLTPAEAGNIAGANDNAAAEEAEFSFEVFQEALTHAVYGTIENDDLPAPHRLLEIYGVMTLLQARDIVRDTVKHYDAKGFSHNLWQYLKACNDAFASLDTNDTEATEAPQAVPSVEDIEAGNEYVLDLPDLEYTTHDDDGLYTLRLRDKTDGAMINAWEMETAPELWRKMNLLCSGASGYKWTKA